MKKIKHITRSLIPSICEKWNEGFDLISLALHNNHKNIAKYLINLGFKITSKNNETTTLHEAVIHGNLELIQLLVKRGNSIFAQDSQLMTPFFQIAKRTPDQECREILKYFLKQGCDVRSTHKKDNFTLAHFAAEYGNDKLMLWLKKKKFPLNTQAKRGLTPLHIAIINKHPNVVSLLLKYVNFDVRNAEYLTALRLAALLENKPAVEILLNQTLRFRKNNFKRQYGSFLLYCAVLIGSKEKTQQFLNAGANINYYIKMTGKNALYVAIENEFEEIVHILLQEGADPDFRQCEKIDKVYLTPLHIATKKGNLTIINMLLDYLPEQLNEIFTLIFNTTSMNVTPYQIAINENHNHLNQLFLKIGKYFFLKEENQLIFLTTIIKHSAPGIFQMFFNEFLRFKIITKKEIQALLIMAAQSNNKEIFTILCQVALESLNMTNCYFALYVATFHELEEFVNYLLRENVDPNYCPRNCLPCLHAAAQRGLTKIFKILLNHSNDYILRTNYFSTILHAATFGGSVEIVEIILNHQVEVDPRLRPSPNVDWNSEIDFIFIHGNYESCDVCPYGLKNGYTPLHFAVENGNVEIVMKLIAFNADINAKSIDNSTPLMLAIQNRHVKIVDCLLRANATIQVADNLTPLVTRAIACKNPDIVKVLLDHHPLENVVLKHFSSTKGCDGFTPLHIAVAEGNAEIVEVLLKANARTNIETQQDFPLHFAIEESDELTVMKLIKYGASLTDKCSQSLSPFLHAVKASKVDMLRFLLWKKVSFEITTENGESLLMFAIQNEVSKYMFKFLLSCGIIVKEKNNNPSLLYAILRERITKIRNFKPRPKDKPYKNIQRCPNGEIYAREEKKNWLLKALLEFDWNPNAWSDKYGESILHFAVRDGRASAVDILLKFGADINAKDMHGATAFYYAANLVNQTPLLAATNQDIYRPPPPMEIITKSLVSTIIRFLMTGKEVIEMNRKLFHNHEFLCSYANYCCDEIRILKMTKISYNITFYSIFQSKEEELQRYSRCKSVRRQKRLGFHKRFPIYAEFLKNRLRYAIKKDEQIEHNFMFFTKLERYNIPLFILFQIFEELSLAELRILDNV